MRAGRLAPVVVAGVVGLGIGAAAMHLADGRAGKPAAPAPPGLQAPATARARPVTYAPRYLAYGRVGPVRDVTVASLVTGTVVDLAVAPGDPVGAGAVLARIAGPRHRAALRRARAVVAGDETALALAKKLAAASGHLLTTGLVTLTKREAAAAKVARATSRLAGDQASLAALEAGGTVRAPAAGTVVTLERAEGDAVAEGQGILTLEPAGGLEVRGPYYGADAAALSAGMTGTFHPAGGAPAVPVTLHRVVPPSGPDGAEEVRCLLATATPGPGWHSGEAGRLVLEGARRKAVAVPTTALVLDQGRFFVVVHGAHGDRPVAVRPGPSRGPETFVEGDLAPGAPVVARGAYLRYHHAFAARYAPPD